MKNKKSTMIAALSLMMHPAHAATGTDDTYSEYVDHMIPIAHAFAKVHTAFHEREVFLNLGTLIQNDLIEASQTLFNIERDISKLLGNDDISACPTLANGALDSQRIYQNMLLESSIEHQLKQAEESIAHYKKINGESPAACESNFESLHFDETEFAIITPNIEILDGVFISIGDFVKSLIDLLGSLINASKNNKEREGIQESTQRYLNLRPQDSDMQKYGKQACDEELQGIQNQFQDHKPYLDSLEKTVAEIKNMPWVRLPALWEGCIRLHETQNIEEWVKETRDFIRQQQEPGDRAIQDRLDQIRLRRAIMKSLNSENKSNRNLWISELKAFRAEADILSVIDPHLINWLNQEIDKP